MLKFYIPHKKENEAIILLVRRHWFVLFIRLMLWAFIGIIPLILYILFGHILVASIENSVLWPLFVILSSLYYLYIWLFLFNSFVDYYLDVWIVTNYRIIDIEQKQLFSRVISEQELDKIQDITAEIHGVIPTFLNFGEIFIQTAGEQQRFAFKNVPNPLEIKRRIIGVMGELRNSTPPSPTSPVFQ